MLSRNCYNDKPTFILKNKLPLWNYFPYAQLSFLAFQSLLFIICVLKKDNGIADIGWGMVSLLLLGFSLYILHSQIHHLLYLHQKSTPTDFLSCNCFARCPFGAAP